MATDPWLSQFSNIFPISKSGLVNGVDEAVAEARSPALEVIANYTAFQQVRALLGRAD